MRAARLLAGAAVLGAALAVTAPAQELTVAAGAGGFFPSHREYRLVYGLGQVWTGEVWFKLKGPVGLAAGFERLSDKGAAVPLDGGDEVYPLEFRRTSVPLVVFYQIEAGPAAFRLGAGLGVHSYRETWRTVDLDFEGRKVSPRLVLAVFVAPVERLSLFCRASAGSIRTGEGSFLAPNIDIGGFQVVGGLAFRIF
ncbi:MAG TPA: hypothetical protein ENO03_04490 [Candidatus Aminicenantes bacterium]|nr:hypothetical protein [Candidatus Aminicenantes bacterium]